MQEIDTENGSTNIFIETFQVLSFDIWRKNQGNLTHMNVQCSCIRTHKYRLKICFISSNIFLSAKNMVSQSVGGFFALVELVSLAWFFLFSRFHFIQWEDVLQKERMNTKESRKKNLGGKTM